MHKHKERPPRHAVKVLSYQQNGCVDKVNQKRLWTKWEASKCGQRCRTSILVHGPKVQLPVEEYTCPHSQGAVTCWQVYLSTVPRCSYLWRSIFVHGPKVLLPVDKYTCPRSQGAVTCGGVYLSTIPRCCYLWTSILVHSSKVQLPVNKYTCPLSQGAVTCGQVYGP